MPVSADAALQAHALARGRHDGHADRHAALVGELHGVAGEVQQHLAQAAAVGQHAGRHVGAAAALDLQPLLGRQRPQQADDVVHEGAHVGPLRHQIQLAGLDLRQVEDVVDDGQERLRRAERHAHPLALLLGQLLLEQQFEHAGHAVHRRADLVAHAGQELRLQPRALDGLFARLDQRLLGRVAIAHVAQDAGEEALVADAPLAARELERDLAPVLAQPGDARRAHRHLIAAGAHAVEHRLVPRAVALGRQHRQRLPHHFLRGVAEEPLDGGVGEQHPAVVVHGDDGVGGGVGQQAVLRLADRQRLVRLGQRGRVPAERHQAHHLAGHALQRGQLRRAQRRAACGPTTQSAPTARQPSSTSGSAA